jgi:hypothetical protein
VSTDDGKACPCLEREVGGGSTQGGREGEREEAVESEGEGSTWGGREGGGIDTEDYLLKLQKTERERGG